MANSAMEVEPMNPDEVKQYLKIYYGKDKCLFNNSLFTVNLIQIACFLSI
jgi:hypothetical protein